MSTHTYRVDRAGHPTEPRGWEAWCKDCDLTAGSGVNAQHALDRLDGFHRERDRDEQFRELDRVYAETRAALRRQAPRPGMTGGF